MRNILFTGGLGKIGVKLINKFNDDKLTIIDNLSNSSIQTAAEFDRKGIKILLEDVRRRKKMLKDIDLVIHLAAKTNVKDSYSDPISDASNNILGTIATIKNYPSKRFVYMSSSEIYGNIKNANETSRPDPESPYGFSKLGGEVYVRMFCKDYLIIRMGAEDIDINTISFLINSGIKGTINIGKSDNMDCSKLNKIMKNYEE